MNEVSKLYGSYPYRYFKESAFHTGHIENILTETYANYSERGIVSSSHLSMNPELYMLGWFSSIMELGYVGDETEEGYIQNLCHQFSGDLWKVVDKVTSEGYMMSMDGENQKLLEHDIRLAFNRMNMFYLRAPGSYETLTYFSKGAHPFSEHMLDKVFANIPIVRVW